MSKPSVFVGSSYEGLEVARAIQVQLSDVSDVQLWNEGIFALGSGFFESLTQSLTRFDFAVLVLTADDVVVSRDTAQPAARDNVFIELGLFTGRLGRERTFVVCQADEDVKVPSDLAGVVFATFSRPSDDTSYISSVGPACVHVRDAIRRLGSAAGVTKLAEAVEENERRVSDQGRELGEQREILRTLQFLTAHLLTRAEQEHLAKLAAGSDFPVFSDAPDAFYTEMHHLRALEFIRGLPSKGLRSMRNERGDVRNHFEITAVGREYLALVAATNSLGFQS